MENNAIVLHSALQDRCNLLHSTDKATESQRVQGLTADKLHINVYMQSPCHTATTFVEEYHMNTFFKIQRVSCMSLATKDKTDPPNTGDRRLWAQ